MKLTPRENYLRMLNHEIPEYVPSSYDNFRDMVSEELLTPVFAPGTLTRSSVRKLPNGINISLNRMFPTAIGKLITKHRKEDGIGQTICFLSEDPITG